MIGQVKLFPVAPMAGELIAVSEHKPVGKKRVSFEIEPGKRRQTKTKR